MLETWIPQWWHWVVFGLCLAMIELFLPTFFMVWFGAGALVLGVLLLLLPSLSFTVQLLLWTALSSGLTVLWFRFFRNQAVHAASSSTAHIVGETGLLVNALTPSTRGHVRFQKPILGAEVWECYAEKDIASDTRVRVVAIEGHFMKVEKA